VGVDIEAAREWLSKKIANEEQAFKAAVEALEAAIDARLNTISALDSVKEAQGLSIGYEPDRIYLAARRARGCKHIVDRALTVTLLDRLGLN
jgi:hypothetical protein